MDAIIQLDKELLLYLNSFHSPLWDNFFWVFTSVSVWIPLYASILWVVWKRLGLKGVWAVLAIVLTIVLCDQVSSSFFKPFFERFRPSWEPSLEGLVRLVNERRGGRFGFVSSHATNSIGLALFTSLLFRKAYFTIFIFIWAIINSYSRIYMGVHYPGDIIGGVLLGAALGYGVYAVYGWFSRKVIFKKGEQKQTFGSEVWISVLIGILSITIIFISSRLLLKLM
ncbi:phosphatase PAP2 family protein [Alkaliflexus imshenetskii]|uniref:phosphatase PAP2 family protein n=1 Tax=Alkaliflexus imshenetskii TaxID=286730 RepID=UPI0004BB77D3|nr:phosphatase PAP2 family protein [Alkaliflexus imshenetskii]